MNNTVVSLRQVSFFFGLRPVLKKVSLELLPGQVVLLCGPNGAGKSTLLKLLAGLVRPTSGQIEYVVQPEKIALMGHECAIYPALTARDNLVFWADIYGLRNSNISALLASVGLADFAGEKAGIFSQGMLQRLELARILLLDPHLLLLDEPTTGLDERSRAFFFTCVQNWKKQNKTVVWVSHDRNQDKKMADIVLFLQAGRLDLDFAAGQGG